ncbi:MAG: hypothetical protein K2W97_02630 [Chthoniobacterales bacterium]|nr:hypothetical protein [Chthoniobacterales bacterium]
MKNKTLSSFLLTALLAASACVMQARAEQSSALCNATQVIPIDSVPPSNYVELNFNISLSEAKKMNQSFSFAVFLSNDGSRNPDEGQYIKLTNADEIDASILSKAGDLWKDEAGSNYNNFTPVGEGTVTLKYEGDIIVKKGDKGTWSWLSWSYSGGSADVTRHITVDEVVTVTE